MVKYQFVKVRKQINSVNLVNLIKFLFKILVKFEFV